MASTTVQARSFVCDHEKCSKVHTVTENQTPPGMEMQVKTNGKELDVYACGRMHVGRAVLSVYDQANGGAPADEAEVEPGLADRVDFPPPN